jgi:hypothetical protein
MIFLKIRKHPSKNGSYRPTMRGGIPAVLSFVTFPGVAETLARCQVCPNAELSSLRRKVMFLFNTRRELLFVALILTVAFLREKFTRFCCHANDCVLLCYL